MLNRAELKAALQSEYLKSGASAEAFAAAQMMLVNVCQDLGLCKSAQKPPIEIKWRKRSEMVDGETGFVRMSLPNEINVANDLGPSDAAKTVAHECFHHLQFKANRLTGLRGADDPDAIEEAEREAIAYENHMWRKFCNEYRGEWYLADPTETREQFKDLLNGLRTLSGKAPIQ